MPGDEVHTAMKRVLIGSGNAHKVAEITALLARHAVAPLRLDDLPEPPPEVEETGSTFEENARLKALAYARAAGLWALADDSGLEVEALGGRPGVFSARFAGPGASDAENNAKLRAELTGVPTDRRGARYVAVLALASPEGVLLEARGECGGRILDEERGSGGFGYDPLFLVPDEGRTFAEMTREEKGRISHRSAALRALEGGLQRLLERP